MLYTCSHLHRYSRNLFPVHYQDSRTICNTAAESRLLLCLNLNGPLLIKRIDVKIDLAAALMSVRSA
jgi:hypothetical protein